MTRQDFEGIAVIVAALHNRTERKFMALAFADWLETKNPRFDRARFLAACGVEL